MMLWGIAGLIKPSWANQPTRKKVLTQNFGLGFLVLVVSIILGPDSLESDQSVDFLMTAREENGRDLHASGFNAGEVFLGRKWKVDDYLGKPEKCSEFKDSVFCQYSRLGTEVYFDKSSYVPYSVYLTKIKNLKFKPSAIKKIGLKTKNKPDFKNKFTIRWDYLDGKEVSIMADTANLTFVSSIHLKIVPLTVSHTAPAGLRISGVIGFALEHLHEELNRLDHRDGANFNLYMDGLIDKYGNSLTPRLIHSFKLSSQEVENLRRYRKVSLFHSESNEFQRIFFNQISSNSLVIRHWPN